ncbi:cyd operon YbgE family protein [Bradyrhizobium sp. dw_78]|uniref:cyd operon YbgE family protein n=1 Tax=Bradyrhizobium sp. dw_78 TaxID=2719793 RepID=UPI001BD6946F|nr:cyd operon YbgE family protein [Bradyrhizobium sp. dw_78]
MPGESGERTTAARLIQTASFAVAAGASLVLMLFPFLLRHVQGAMLHPALSILLLGITGAFVYGIGFRPENRWLRILFGPACAWTLMIGGALLLFVR